MKQLITLIILGLAFSSFEQKDFSPSSRKKAFGKVDRRQLRLTGLQVELGPAYSFTRAKKMTGDFTDGGTRGNYEIDPKGRFGGYIDIGMAHYLKNPIAVGKKEKGQFIIFNMVDWGLGFKYIGGQEQTTINYTDVAGNTISTDESGFEKFYNGYLTGRFSLHRSFTPKKWEKVFFDTHIGFNVDYRLITADENSNYHTSYAEPFSPAIQYHKPLVAQMHLGAAVGFKMRKGTNLFVGLRAPAVGIWEWNKANPANYWFSSRYWPVFLHVKVINLFQKKNKNSCNNVNGNEDDKKRNEEFMMGN
ncbi:MAG: hypothetical protein AB8B56_00140 [Crocinitomicaceae bacterium]